MHILKRGLRGSLTKELYQRRMRWDDAWESIQILKITKNSSLFPHQSSSGVSSKVLDDYCWVHSTFHIRTEYQVCWLLYNISFLIFLKGTVGCIVDSGLLPVSRHLPHPFKWVLILPRHFKWVLWLTYSALCAYPWSSVSNWLPQFGHKEWLLKLKTLQAFD